MKSVVAWLVVLVAIVGGAGVGLWQYNLTTRENTYEMRLAELKRDFLNKSVGLRILDAETYRKEVGIALTHYFSELAKLAKEFPEFYEIEREKRIGIEAVERGHMNESRQLAREERIDIALDLFKRMRSGQYRPLYTASDKTFRFDIYDISPAKVSGESRVKASHVHWGAFGPVDYRMITGNMVAEPEEGKPVSVHQLVGEGQPPNLQINPEEWVHEFPPGMEIGYYDLPQFPREADGVQFSFEFSIRTIGGTPIDVHIAFPEIAIPESWKVPEGQAWEAQQRFASDEELQEAGAAVPKLE